MSERISKERVNKAVVVGELVEVKTEVKSFDNREVLVGHAVVKSVIDGVENLIKFSVMTGKITSKNEVSKLFIAHNKLDSFLNQRVRVQGELGEGSFLNDSGDDLISFNQINLKFIEGVADTIADAATFDFSGFVVRPLYEVTDKDGNTVGYRIEIAQESYRGDFLTVIKFDVDSADTSITSAVESYYLPGETVNINGVLGSVVTEIEKVSEVAFGTASTEVIQRTNRTFSIKGGSEPFADSSPTKYTDEDIANLTNIYKTKKTEKIEREKAKRVGDNNSAGAAMNALTANSGGGNAVTPKPNRAASLI